MRILVTGGAGFIGAALVKRLVEDGAAVVVLDDFSRGRRDRLAGVSCQVMEGDIRNAWAVEQAMQGCNLVAHLAYMQGTQTFYAEPRQVLDVAVSGINSVLKACEATGCGRLLLVSSSEVYQETTVIPTPETVPLIVPDPLNPRYSYGAGKIISELMSIAWSRTGVLDQAIIVRPHNIIGPDMGREHVVPEFALRMNRLLRAAHDAGADPRSREPIQFPIQGSGEETRSFCYIDDCVGQMAAAMTLAPRGEHIYHVGVEDERSIADVAHAVAACYGREIKIVPGALPKGSPTRRLPDTRKIRALMRSDLTEMLGLECAAVPFREAIERTVDWYRAND